MVICRLYWNAIIRNKRPLILGEKEDKIIISHYYVIKK
jgi:hypothetical protein